MSLRRATAIVGVGATPYYKRGASRPKTLEELVCTAIIEAARDAGLDIADIDGFSYFGGGFDSGYLMESLGIPEIHFSAMITGKGGGSAGAVGLAAAAVASGMAKTVVCIGGLQQDVLRYGAMPASYAPSPRTAFFASAGLVLPGSMFGLIARRHMHLYGTTREHYCEVALSARANAVDHPAALIRKPLTRDDYFAAPIIADPHCLFDHCLESDGAIAVLVTSLERARDLRQPPVVILASAHGGSRKWGRALYWMNMPEPEFASSGHEPVARQLYEIAGVGPGDIDTAQLYDHFSSQVICQLEDYGFCKKGEGGPFVASGAIRRDGRLPINTDGGQLSGGYIWGMSHVREAVHQIRGDAFHQVTDAELALVTGGPSDVPVSGLIVAKDNR